MKYVALWLGIAAALFLLMIIAIAAVFFVQTIGASYNWIGIPIIAIILIATIAVVVDYLSDHREPKIGE